MITESPKPKLSFKQENNYLAAIPPMTNQNEQIVQQHLDPSDLLRKQDGFS